MAPKPDTDETWEWQIKDHERRTLSLTEEIVHLLANHQSEQPSGCPYVFISPERLEQIKERRKAKMWNPSS